MIQGGHGLLTGEEDRAQFKAKFHEGLKSLHESLGN
jgi:hypothetical protein